MQLGEKFKNARKAKDFTLQDVARVTKIPESTLQLIEDDRYDDLPADFYVKGFLKTFAQAVGLDVHEVLEIFQKHYSKNSRQVLVLQGEKLKSIDFMTFIKRIDPKLWIGLFVSLFIILILIKIVSKDDETMQAKMHPIRTASSTLILPQEIQRQNESSEMLTLSGKSKEDVWLRVHADGGLVFEGILKKGNKETWLAKVDFKIRIGNQDAIVFKLNGKDLGPLGEPGKVLEVRLTKEGKWINDRSQ